MNFFKHIKVRASSIAVLAMLVSFSGYSNHTLPQIESSEWIVQNASYSSYGVYKVYEASKSSNHFKCYSDYNFKASIVSFNAKEQVSFKSNSAYRLLLKSLQFPVRKSFRLPVSTDDVDHIS